MSQLMMRAHSCLRLRKLTLNKNASTSIVNRAVRNSSTRSQLSSDDQAAAAASGNEQSANVILMKILHMIRSFRNRGHFCCQILCNEPIPITISIDIAIHMIESPLLTYSTWRFLPRPFRSIIRSSCCGF